MFPCSIKPRDQYQTKCRSCVCAPAIFIITKLTVIPRVFRFDVNLRNASYRQPQCGCVVELMKSSAPAIKSFLPSILTTLPQNATSFFPPLMNQIFVVNCCRRRSRLSSTSEMRPQVGFADDSRSCSSIDSQGMLPTRTRQLTCSFIIHAPFFHLHSSETDSRV